MNITEKKNVSQIFQEIFDLVQKYENVCVDDVDEMDTLAQQLFGIEKTIDAGIIIY